MSVVRYCLILAFLTVAVVLIANFAVAHAEEERFEPSSRSPRVERWRYLVEQYDDWNHDLALDVMWCESQGDPGVDNRQGSGAKGLYQLLGWEWLARKMFGPQASVYDPAVNVAVAHEIYVAAGRRFGTSMGWRASVGCWG